MKCRINYSLKLSCSYVFAFLFLPLSMSFASVRKFNPAGDAFQIDRCLDLYFNKTLAHEFEFVPRLDARDPYQILGLASSDVSDEEVDRAGREAVRRYHSDLRLESNTDHFSKVNEAWKSIRESRKSTKKNGSNNNLEWPLVTIFNIPTRLGLVLSKSENILALDHSNIKQIAHVYLERLRLSQSLNDRTKAVFESFLNSLSRKQVRDAIEAVIPHPNPPFHINPRALAENIAENRSALQHFVNAFWPIYLKTIVMPETDLRYLEYVRRLEYMGIEALKIRNSTSGQPGDEVVLEVEPIDPRTFYRRTIERMRQVVSGRYEEYAPLLRRVVADATAMHQQYYGGEPIQILAFILGYSDEYLSQGWSLSHKTIEERAIIRFAIREARQMLRIPPFSGNSISFANRRDDEKKRFASYMLILKFWHDRVFFQAPGDRGIFTNLEELNTKFLPRVEIIRMVGQFPGILKYMHQNYSNEDIFPYGGGWYQSYIWLPPIGSNMRFHEIHDFQKNGILPRNLEPFREVIAQSNVFQKGHF